MRRSRFILASLLMLACQVVIWNYLDLSQYIMLAVLPSIILCLPTRVNTNTTLIITFLAALAADFFTHGILGLTVVAALPVALFKRRIVSLICGEDVLARDEDISFRRQGLWKMLFCIIICSAIFLFFYIWADGAGMRPFWFNLLRFLLSLIASSLTGILVASILTSEDSSQWR